MTTWGLSNKAFWDVRFEEIDFEKQARFVIEKVFNHGTWNDQIAVLRYYGTEKVSTEAIKINYLRPTAISFLSAILDLPKASFKCYTSKQFHPIPWDY